MTTDVGQNSGLPAASSVLAVCAHPDDESFGLGAVLDSFASRGATVSVLCFTHGEASTLGSVEGGLGALRGDELRAAAAELGIGRLEQLDRPDGSLGAVPLDQLGAQVAALAAEVRADLLLVFDQGGVTGHPDHCRATEAALASTPDLPVLAWTLPRRVTEVLNAEFGSCFVGRVPAEIDAVVRVERARQQRAVACHDTQSGDNPVLWRRLEVLGSEESLRWLRRPAPATEKEWTTRAAGQRLAGRGTRT